MFAATLPWRLARLITAPITWKENPHSKLARKTRNSLFISMDRWPPANARNQLEMPLIFNFWPWSSIASAVVIRYFTILMGFFWASLPFPSLFPSIFSQVLKIIEVFKVYSLWINLFSGDSLWLMDVSRFGWDSMRMFLEDVKRFFLKSFAVFQDGFRILSSFQKN